MDVSAIDLRASSFTNNVPQIYPVATRKGIEIHCFAMLYQKGYMVIDTGR